MTELHEQTTWLMTFSRNRGRKVKSQNHTTVYLCTSWNDVYILETYIMLFYVTVTTTTKGHWNASYLYMKFSSYLKVFWWLKLIAIIAKSLQIFCIFRIKIGFEWRQKFVTHSKCIWQEQNGWCHQVTWAKYVSFMVFINHKTNRIQDISTKKNPKSCNLGVEHKNQDS